MSELKLMPDPLDIREISFTNLLMLGFDVQAMESEYRIPFNRDMFSMPNRKAMEVVIHFLFTRLNRDSAKQSYRSCWPIVEKRQETEFRRVSIEWLKKIKIDDPDCPIPTVVPILLLSPSGNKFYQFLFYFTLYVLIQSINKMPKKYGTIPQRPVISHANKKYLPQLVGALGLKMINHRKRLTDIVEETVLVKNTWIEFASELSKEHRKLNKKKREWDKKLKEVNEQMQLVCGKSVVSSKDVLKRTQDLQKVTENWQTISKLHETQKKLKEQIDFVINNKKNVYSLEGGNINFKLPDILLRECERQLNMGKLYQNIYEEGKVDLTSLLHLWNLSLHLIKEAITQFPLPIVDQDEEYIRAEAHKHGNNLNCTMSLRNILSNELLPDLNLSIEELKETIREQSSVKAPLAPIPNQFSLDILPCTPPVAFDFKAVDIAPNGLAENNFCFETPVATPDAVNNILNRIHTQLNEDTTPVNPIVVNNAAAVVNKRNIAAKEVKTTKVTHARNVKHKETSKIPMRKYIHNKHMEDGKVTVDDKKLTADNKGSDMLKAQEILTEQIAQSVLNSAGFSDNSDEEVDIHAFEKPFEAFNPDVFVRKDKVPRTPAEKGEISHVANNTVSYTPFLRYQEGNKSEIEITPREQTSTFDYAMGNSIFTPLRTFDESEKTLEENCSNVDNNLENVLMFTPLHDFEAQKKTPKVQASKEQALKEQSLKEQSLKKQSYKEKVSVLEHNREDLFDNFDEEEKSGNERISVVKKNIENLLTSSPGHGFHFDDVEKTPNVENLSPAVNSLINMDKTAKDKATITKNNVEKLLTFTPVDDFQDQDEETPKGNQCIKVNNMFNYACTPIHDFEDQDETPKMKASLAAKNMFNYTCSPLDNIEDREKTPTAENSIIVNKRFNHSCTPVLVKNVGIFTSIHNSQDEEESPIMELNIELLVKQFNILQTSINIESEDPLCNQLHDDNIDKYIVSEKHCNGDAKRNKRDIGLFLENNKYNLNCSPNIKSINKDSFLNCSRNIKSMNNDSVKFVPTDNLISFATPGAETFKRTYFVKSTYDDIMKSPANMSFEEVDDFIEEVILKTTPVFSRDVKSKAHPSHFFHTPDLSNDFNLLTPDQIDNWKCSGDTSTDDDEL